MAQAKTDLVPAGQNNGALVVAPEVLEALLADSGDGFQGMRPEDMALPFLGIVQSQSPQRKKNHEKFIEGASDGDIYNSVTGTLYQDGVRVIPCHYQKVFVEWRPDRGGFVAEHGDTDPIIRTTTEVRGQNDKVIKRLPNGNELVETAKHFVVVIGEDGTLTRALIALSSSGLSVSRKWNSLMTAPIKIGSQTLATPPMYASAYLLRTVERANDKGQWFVFSVSPSGYTWDKPELYAYAKAFYHAVVGGEIKVDFNKSADANADALDAAIVEKADEIM